MGFLDRLIRGVNGAYEPFQELDTALFHDRSISRADKLAAGGAAANGVIVGMKRRLVDTVEEQQYAIQVVDAEGTLVRFGVQVGDGAQPRLRLGLPVIARTDGKKAVLDLGSMFAAWGVPGGDAIQRTLRNAPADGLEDTALDMRVERRLKTWTATTGTIASMDAVTAFGMATQNWDVHVTLPDGTTSTSRKDQVPLYAYWYAHPGATVPVAVDPDDPRRCAIDWPVVGRGNGAPIAFADEPPEGSLVERIEARTAVPTEAAGMGADRPDDGTVAGRDLAASNATMRSWLEAYQGGYLKAKEYHRSVDDWRAAGMCTAEEAEAAHAQVPRP